MVRFKRIFSVRNIVTLVTFILVAIVGYKAKDEINLALMYLGTANIWIILMLVPEQLFMYYCNGQMFFSYMRANNKSLKVSPWTLARVAFELNFVNHAIPSGGVSGLGYIAWRLKKFGATAGQTSFMYILRYFITIISNEVQTLLALLALILMKVVPKENNWAILLAFLAGVAVIFGIFLIIFFASSKKRIDFISRLTEKVFRRVSLIFRRKYSKERADSISSYFNDLYNSLSVARKNPRLMLGPIVWGVVYSFFEIGSYWVVAISLGHPEVLPQIMVAEAIGSTIGAVFPTPGGAGGYDIAMISMMSLLGVDASLAAAVVIPTRVIVLIGTVLSGYGFYQHAILTANKKELKKMKEE